MVGEIERASVVVGVKEVRWGGGEGGNVETVVKQGERGGGGERR